MLKRLLSAAVLVAMFVATGLATTGCANDDDIYVERHEEENTVRTRDPKMVVE